MEQERQDKYVRLYDLMTQNCWKPKPDLDEVKRFVESEGITSEEYSTLQKTPPDYMSRISSASPVCAAALICAPDILKYFISLGFDPHGAPNGHRPIHSACEYWHNICYEDEDDEEEEEEEVEKKKNQSKADTLEVVRILVEGHKVDVNVTTSRDLTPLLYAAEEGYENIVKLLVKAGADVNVRDNHKGWNALHFAAISGSPELCEYLLSLGLTVDDMDGNERQPLHYAAYNGHAKAAEILLDAGSDVNRLDRWDCSPLGSALMSGDLDVIRVLCSRGANTHYDDNVGVFLHRAINDDAFNIVRFFVVEMGVSPDIQDFCDDTAFSVALKKGNMEVAKLLISCGCSIDRDACVFDESVLQDSSVSPEEWKTFLKDVQEMAETPRKLQETCCFKIRSLLGKHITESVNTLSIPNSLKNVLLLKHV